MAAWNATPQSARFKDLTGKRFGRWTVLHYAGRKTNSLWFCRCDCGTETLVAGPHLTRGNSTRCRQCGGVGVVTHGMSESQEFTTWRGMIERCTNRKHKQYDDYGGRGICVCDRWAQSFEAFFKDMGPKPTPSHSIDRFPNGDGNYEPGNCRWATQSQQMRNTRRTRRLTFRGRTLSIPDWADVVGISVKTLRTRLAAGWTVERALTETVNR